MKQCLLCQTHARELAPVLLVSKQQANHKFSQGHHYCTVSFACLFSVMRASRAGLPHCQLAAWQAFAVGRELPGVSQPNIAAM